MKILFILFFCSFSLQAANLSIFNTKTKSFEPIFMMKENIKNNTFFILGENHNRLLIHEAQAQIIELFTQENPSVFWEFLNHHEQDNINLQLSKLYCEQLTLKEFIGLTAGKLNQQYSPLISLIQKYKLPLYGANFARKYKQQLIKEGIESVQPGILPKHFFEGTLNYKSRFQEVMREHIPEELFEKYYQAQYLTDSMMAEVLVEKRSDKNFLIAGSFHTDFYDATIFALKELSNLPIVSFKFVELKSLSKEDITDLKFGHFKYGPYADYIIFVD